MKRYISILALLLASQLYPQSKMDINNLIDRGGLLYAPNDDKPYTGKVFDFYDNGKKSEDGRYRKGLKNGKWTYYTEIGNGKYEVKYTDGTYNMAVFTDSLGTDYTGSPITDEPGQDGTYLLQESGEEYDFSIFPELFATVKDREADGLVTEWYENGQKSSERTSKDGKENGLWTEWYENGQKEEEGTWKDGERDGLHTRWSPNGKESSEVLYNDGKQDGLRTYWYANGQKWREETYKDGELDGSYTRWYANGQKWREETYKDGELDGLGTEWYENGQKRREATVKDGILDGLRTWWYENGQKLYEGTYKDGKWISSKCWDEDGNECECTAYGSCK